MHSNNRNVTFSLVKKSVHCNKVHIRSALFWDIKQCRMVVFNWRFGTTYQCHLEPCVKQSKKDAGNTWVRSLYTEWWGQWLVLREPSQGTSHRTAWPLQMWLIGLPKMLVRNYHSKLCKITIRAQNSFTLQRKPKITQTTHYFSLSSSFPAVKETGHKKSFKGRQLKSFFWGGVRGILKLKVTMWLQFQIILILQMTLLHHVTVIWCH